MYKMGEPRIKIVAMPKDTNPSGNIFGGWIMSQIDIAGSLAIREITHGRVVTVAVNSMVFKKPVHVGDIISCYAKVIYIGKTSIQSQVEVMAEKAGEHGNVCEHVTSAVITYVHVGQDGKKRPIAIDKSILSKLNLDT